MRRKKKIARLPRGEKAEAHSRDSMNALCLERQRICACVCVWATPPRVYAYTGLGPPSPTVTKAYSLVAGARVRSRFTGRAYEWKSERELARACVRSQIMTTFTALRPIRERPTFGSLFRRCVQYKNLSWCNGPRVTRLTTRFRVRFFWTNVFTK